ncbi:MAG: cupin domain-containing protein [Gammaproteobacteria bacterium]|nr:cupin domain-containing protein [Gammaproteobacteria bacterium]MBI5618366.1 cupin domain-containing protein [Gammaproteobacteria bacterium]
MTERPPIAVAALDVPLRLKASNYPEPFASLMAGRVKRQLGEVFGLANFGVNLVRLASGSRSALRHAHSRQDEFVYVLEGEAVLVTDRGETALGAGMCAGFRAGSGDAHYLLNRSAGDALYLEIGDRTPGDEVSYPDDDIEARLGGDGRWQFVRKNGEPY